MTKKTVDCRVVGHLKSKSHIGHSLRKYGLQSFNISVIDVADDHETLVNKEKYWIKFYNCKSPNGYNHTDGGECTKFSEDSLEKMRKPKSEEARRNMKEAQNLPEQKEKHRKPMSEKAKQKMKATHLTKESMRKKRESHLGQVPWNKGLTKETSDIVKRTSEKNTGKTGHPSWNKGLVGFSCRSKETREMMRIARLGKKFPRKKNQKKRFPVGGPVPER